MIITILEDNLMVDMESKGRVEELIKIYELKLTILARYGYVLVNGDVKELYRFLYIATLPFENVEII